MLYAQPNPNARHSAWADEVITPFTATGGFDVGMAIDILGKVRQMLPGVEITMSPEIKHLISPLNIPEHKLQNYIKGDFEARDYQHDSVVRTLQTGRNTILLPTGAGKSLTTYGILKNLLEYDVYPILMIVPNLQLVSQAYTDFIEYGMHKNLLQRFSAKFNRTPDDNPIIITNTQFLMKHVDKLPDIKAVYVDECHMLKDGSKITNIVKKFKTPIKIGCTATLPDDYSNLWSVIGTLGPVVKKEKITNLIEKGYLSNVSISSIQFEHLDTSDLSRNIEMRKNEKQIELNEMIIALKGMTKNTPQYNALYKKYIKLEERPINFYLEECRYIESHKMAIYTQLKFISRLKGNVVVMFNRTDHGKLLYKVLTRMCPNMRVDYVDGTVDLDVRLDATESMEQSENNVIISNTKCFGTGVNIKRINHIVIAAGGKAFITTLQVIGRGLRTHKLKNGLHLWDIHHDLKYSTEHFEYRQQLYLDNYGLCVDIDKKIQV
jgi:superfamily II DNA or RNA helicase